MPEMGATGEFPDGKLTPDDEGALQFSIGHQDGKVVLDFGTPTVWIGMEPQQARDLARCLFDHARRCSDAKGPGMPPKQGGCHGQRD